MDWPTRLNPVCRERPYLEPQSLPVFNAAQLLCETDHWPRGPEMYLPIWLRLWGALGTGMFNIKIMK